jgi:hypothetical protein
MPPSISPSPGTANQHNVASRELLNDHQWFYNPR